MVAQGRDEDLPRQREELLRERSEHRSRVLDEIGDLVEERGILDGPHPLLPGDLHEAPRERTAALFAVGDDALREQGRG